MVPLHAFIMSLTGIIFLSFVGFPRIDQNRDVICDAFAKLSKSLPATTYGAAIVRQYGTKADAGVSALIFNACCYLICSYAS